MAEAGFDVDGCRLTEARFKELPHLPRTQVSPGFGIPGSPSHDEGARRRPWVPTAALWHDSPLGVGRWGGRRRRRVMRGLKENTRNYHPVVDSNHGLFDYEDRTLRLNQLNNSEKVS
jgi:hypothetical protein